MKRFKRSLRKDLKTCLISSTALQYQNLILKHLSTMVAFSMIKLEFTVDAGQKLMEADFICTI